jgi:hypothetical protein
MLAAAGTAQASYPLTPDSLCGSSRTCRTVVNQWNDASWSALVDDSFQTGAPALAAVRHYTTEGSCTGTLCSGEAATLPGKTIDLPNSRFVGVTDEFSNVLLNHSIGSDEDRFEKLRNFAEMLRLPSINNNLQCWKYYVDGDQAYSSGSQLCVEQDSASDASLRILGAYGIACARQRSGNWARTGRPDYCADYVRQGNAIWGIGSATHGEIKKLANGQYYLANGYNNQVAAPTNTDAFRPDYYELQFLMDFAEYIGDSALITGVVDMMRDYVVATGTNRVHCGKTGHFDQQTTVYFCDQLCSPPYLDNIDTWRAVPALGGFRAVHGDRVPVDVSSTIFDQWWLLYGGGNASYGYSSAKPFEIYCNASDGQVKQTEESYKTLGMWIPLAAAYDHPYARNAVGFLTDQKYDWTLGRFYGAAYFGGYFSQFAQRAIGVSTGMIDPATYPPTVIFADGFEQVQTLPGRWESQAP